MSNLFCSSFYSYCDLVHSFKEGVLSFEGFPGGLVVKNPPAKQEMQAWSLGQEDPLKNQMATASVFLPGKPYRGAWLFTVHGVAKSWTQLSNNNAKEYR